MKKQISPQIVSLVFAVMVICFAIVFYVVAWEEPDSVPPGDNVPAPLNTGLISQVKEGALGIYGVFRAVGGADPAIEPGLVVNNGNVGIGDITPNAKLDVEGDARFDYSGGYTTIADSSGVQVYNAEGTTGQVRLGAAWSKPGVYSSGALYLFSDTTGVYIGDSNSEKMFVRADGNVGIGTIDPGTNKLEVVGGPIKATGGLIIETRTSDPASPETGRMWLRTDL